MKNTFCVDLEKEQLIFSAAHFITFGDDICESIHGHNYRIRCRVSGPLNRHGYVVDFIALRDALSQIAKSLDHRVLLPESHPQIRVQVDGPEVVVTFAERRWIFPRQDCALLPVDNTTAERLAEYIAHQLLETAGEILATAEELVVAVDENEGQWGECRRRLG